MVHSSTRPVPRIGDSTAALGTTATRLGRTSGQLAPPDQNPAWTSRVGAATSRGVANFDRNSTGPYPASNYVTIDHGNGFTTQYYHLRRDSLLVGVGSVVSRGQKIAEMASSGNSTNPHLHWGVYYHGMQVEPGVGMSQYMAAPLT